jgi:hypothetical protein
MTKDLKGVYNMNTRFLKTAFLMAALGVFALAANAQSPVARASVPFDFAAGGAMLPAGNYTVDVPDFSGVIILHGPSGNSVALMTTFSDSIPNATAAKLIFERRDGMAYLSAVEWPDQNAKVVSVFKRITKGAVAAALR